MQQLWFDNKVLFEELDELCNYFAIATIFYKNDKFGLITSGDFSLEVINHGGTFWSSFSNTPELSPCPFAGI